MLADLVPCGLQDTALERIAELCESKHAILQDVECLYSRAVQQQQAALARRELHAMAARRSAEELAAARQACLECDERERQLLANRRETEQTVIALSATLSEALNEIAQRVSKICMSISLGFIYLFCLLNKFFKINY